tara:strand:+ start:18249 stop:19376 length:1128 start_codon:yes stop_codon:yes gene_type:complete
MAYNLLKGVVEGSVDQYGDQEIGGIKVFKNTISASVFYDTDAQSPCVTMKDVAITEIVRATDGAILVCDKTSGARAHKDLTYDGKILKAKDIQAERLFGSAKGLSDIPVDKFTGAIASEYIKHGAGLNSVRGTLQVNIGSGLRNEDGSIEVSLGSNSGLSIKNKKLVVDPSISEKINSMGQNVADTDLLLIADVSRSTTTNTTLKNLYDSYISLKVPHAHGQKGELQIKGPKEFNSSPRLTYDSTASLLNVSGQIRTTSVRVDEKMVCEGAMYHNIKKIDVPHYEVGDEDYTILCDSLKNKITVSLPPACNQRGRVLIVKKTNTNKYKLNSHVVEIKCEEGPIDLLDAATIKMNYSARTFQSDGTNWWIINKTGS